jgi:antibiotic biosynthesis monooxygenase (ABM) superfamily enzyme
MSKITSLSRSMWIAIWAVALSVTLVGGTWSAPTSTPPNWKLDIQMPGSFIVLYLGWFMGPFQTIMSPPIVSVMTILINVLVYYVVVRMFLIFRRRLKKTNSAV